MILIVSHDAVDEPTNLVIDWLSFYNADFKRINGNDFLPNKDILFNINKKIIFDNNCKILDSSKIDVVWYRRWNPQGSVKSYYEKYKKLDFTQEEVSLIENYNKFIQSELNVKTRGIFSLFNNIECIPKIKHARGGLNKLDVLMYADDSGLLIPNTIVTSSKSHVLDFLKNNKSIITKPISEVIELNYKDENFVMYTQKLEIEEIKKFKDYFYPSLFQQQIEKDFEIRTFVHYFKIYSMAIFSQRDSLTNVDFRNYNFEKPNRNVPFKLPKAIEKKLLDLFKKLDLTTGSVDFILDKKGNYYFLEINPVGQLSMVSNGCNYFLEKMIANDLIKINNESKKQKNKVNS